MANRDLAVRAINQDRLRVQQPALPRRRVPHVPDGGRPGQARQRLAIERVGDVAHRPRDAYLPAIRGGDARALLSPMLQRVQTEVRHVGGLEVAEDAEDTALVLELIEHVFQATRFATYCSIAVDHTRSASSTD